MGEHPDLADTIATAGLQAVMTPSQMIDGILDVVVGKRCHARVYFRDPGKSLRNGEFAIALAGLQRSSRVKLVERPWDADLILLDLFRLKLSGVDFPKMLRAYGN